MTAGHADTPHPMPVTRQLIVQGGHASGDQVAIAAMLLQDPTAHVLITTPNQPPVPPPDGHDNGTREADIDASGSIRAFYRSSGIADDRIHLLPVADLRDEVARIAAARQALTPPGPLSHLPPFTLTGPHAAVDALQRSRPVSQSGHSDRDSETDRNGTLTSNGHGRPGHALQTLLRQSWGRLADPDPDPASSGAAAWLQARDLSPQSLAGKKVIVLWTPPGLSSALLHQIVEELKAAGPDTLILTHPAASGPDAAPDLSESDADSGLQDLITRFSDSACQVIGLTGFPTAEATVETAAAETPADPRLAQIALHDHLTTAALPHAAAFLHIGPRSLPLDALALLGHPVLCLEPLFPPDGIDSPPEPLTGIPGLQQDILLLDTPLPPAGSPLLSNTDRASLTGFARTRLAQLHLQHLQQHPPPEKNGKPDRATYLTYLRALEKVQIALKVALQLKASVLQTRQQQLDTALNDQRTASSPVSIQALFWTAQHLADEKKRAASHLEKISHSQANTLQALTLLEDLEQAAAAATATTAATAQPPSASPASAPASTSATAPVTA